MNLTVKHQTMPEILPSYAISELPQTSSNLDVRAAMHCGSSRIYLGISHSSLAMYSLKSTPRLVWTHAISPVTKVMAVQAVNQIGENSSKFLYFATINKYGAGSLRRISVQPQDEEQAEQILLEKCDPIIDIRSSQDGNSIYLLFQSGSVQCLSVNEEGIAKVEWTSQSPSTSLKVIFHDYLASGSIDMPEDGLFVTVLKNSDSKDSSVQVRMVALDESDGNELVYSTVKTSTSSGVFGLHMGSLLYFDPHTFSLSTYSLPNLALLSTIQVRRNQKSPTEKASLLPVGKNRILLSYDNTLKLVDTKYNTILSKRVLDKPIQLAAFSNKNSLAVGFTDTEIVSLPVEPGTGSLLESLGKGVISHDSKWDLVHSSFIFDQQLDSTHFIEQQTKLNEQQKASITNILSVLYNWLKSGKTDAYQNWAIAYLKNEDWSDNADNVPEIISSSSNETLIYDASNDREVDASFISAIVGQVFASKNKTIDQIDPTRLRLPESPLDSLVVYLLTHPLFPTPQFPTLLSVLSSNPRLYRQAIVTAAGLGCDQLVSALQVPDDDIFKDAISRITDEFGTRLITESIKKVFKSNEPSQAESQVTSIVKCVERMQSLDLGWSIMACFIDAGGLFAWDEQLLSSLQTRVDEEVEDLNTGSETLTILEEALKLADYREADVVRKVGVNDTVDSLGAYDDKHGKKPKISKKKKKILERKAAEKASSLASASASSVSGNGPELISAQEQNLQRIQALLSFGSSTKSGLHRADLRESLARSVPPYTVEKLIL